MNQRFKHIILFICLLAVCHVLLLMGYQKSRQGKEIVRTFECYDSNPKEYKFLFLGTSHVKRGIDTSVVHSSLSMAYYGQNNISAYYLLKYFLENHADNFEYVCLPNDFDFYSNRAIKNLDHKYFYHDFFNYNEYGRLNNSVYKSKKEEWLLSYFPYTQLKKMLRSNKGRALKGEKDFSLFDESVKNKLAHDYVFNQHNIENVNDIYAPLSITYLKMTLQLLEKHDKKAIFIHFPLSSAMNEEILKLGAYDHKSDSLILEFGHTIIDESNTFNNKDEYFFDAHHLNNKGGLECSRIIEEKLTSF